MEQQSEGNAKKERPEWYDDPTWGQVGKENAFSEKLTLQVRSCQQKDHSFRYVTAHDVECDVCHVGFTLPLDMTLSHGKIVSM